MIKYISLLFFTLITVSSVFAQSNSTNKEVKVISKYKSVLPDADKIDKVPVLVDTIKSNVKFSYSLNPHPDLTVIDLFSDNAPKIKGEPLNDLDGGYLKLGGGNYSTWMGEFAFNNKRSKKYDWGLYLYNKYSDGNIDIKERGKEKAGYTNTDAMLYGKRFFENSVASISLDYNFDKVRYYGYAESPDQINAIQKFNDIGVNLSYSSVYKDKLNYTGTISYNNFKDDFSKWEENLFVADFVVKGELFNNILSGDLRIEHVAQNKWTDFSMFSLNPKYRIQTGRFIFDLGIGVSFKTGGDKDFYFYPKTRVKYAMVKDIMSIYAFANGGIKNNTYSAISKENPFVILDKPDLRIASNINTTTFCKYKLGGGVKGQFARFVSFNIGASYKVLEDEVFYSNYRKGIYGVFVQEKYFSPVYDDVKVFNILAELSADIDKDITVSSVFNYYKYTLTDLEYAIHKPEAEVRFKMDYKYNSSLKFGAELFYIGERYGSNYKKLDSNIDVSLNAEYKFSDYVYSFARVNNLFDTEYEKWQGYPNYGINLMAGVSFCF
jgi:hypothetical protein